jgi:outer membrane protein assembly factor BamB
LKYLILSTLKTGEVNSDRKNISFFSIEKLNGKDAILASDLKNWFIFDVDTHTELLNIKRDNNSMNRAVGTIYNSSIYYTSESNELSRYDIKSNKVSWSVKLPDKAVKIIGIKLSSVPSLITCIMPFTKNNKDYIGVITNGVDYYSFDALVGKLVKNDIQYEKFNDISQNNSKLFVNSYIYKDKKADKLLIYAASIDKNVYCLNEKDFSTVWETPTGNEIYSPLTFLDINNDSYPEVFGVNDYDENLFILDGKTGKKIVFHSLKEGKQFNRTRVYLADLHGTGTLNLIVKTNNEKIKVFELSQIKVPKNYISTFHTVSE